MMNKADQKPNLTLIRHGGLILNNFFRQVTPIDFVVRANIQQDNLPGRHAKNYYDAMFISQLDRVLSTVSPL